MSGKARNRLIKAARKDKPKNPALCPLMSTGWAAPVPGQAKQVMQIGQHVHADQPMVNGFAQVPCIGETATDSSNEDVVRCAWWDKENKQCAVNGLTALMEMMVFDDDEPGEGGDYPEPITGGDDDGEGKKEPVTVDSGAGEAGP